MKRIAIVLVILITFFTNKVNAYNKSVIDIEDLTLEDIIEYLDKEIITSEELVNLYLDRINTYNSEYNAIININNNIINEAIESDELRKNNQKRGILEGIPILVKDNIDVLGMPTTAGSLSLSDNMPVEDSEVIKKLKENGALIIAKTNMSEFAFSAKDSNSSYGYVYNAFNKEYTSYGSSGGSAVGVALSFAPIALGTDTNSSVRLPASAAGLVGLRPTTNILSNKGVIPYDITRDTIGIISKSVNDNKIILDILRENTITEKKETITIGIPNSFYIGNPKSSINANKETFEPIKNAMTELITKLQEHNINIVYLDNFYGSNESYYHNISISGFTMCKAFNEYINGTTGKIRNFKELTYSEGKTQSLKGYLKSCNYKEKYLNRNKSYQNKLRTYIDTVYENNNLDYIMYPTTKNEIYIKGENYKLLNVSATISSTIGYPAITLPLTYYNNMPYGVELLAKSNEEEKLYNIASLIQEINNLTNIHPNINKLYEVDENTKILVSLYLDNYDNEEKKEWLNKVKEYFRNYNKEEKNDSKILIEEFNKKEEIEIEKPVEKEIKKKSNDVRGVISIIPIILISLLPYYCKKKIKYN